MSFKVAFKVCHNKAQINIHVSDFEGGKRNSQRPGMEIIPKLKTVGI